MSTITLERVRHLGETPELEDHENDLINDLGRRLGCLWQYDRYIVNADGYPELQAFWRDAKLQEQRNVDQIKILIQQHVEGNALPRVRNPR